MNRDEVNKDRYIRHLASFVGLDGEEDLLHQLDGTPFVWVIPNDINRCEDGRELRIKILEDMDLTPDEISDFDILDVSVLEVLAVLAERMSMQVDHSIEECFSIFMENLDLAQFIGNWTGPASFIVDDILADWMTRNISSDGTGGLFPLKEPHIDQREVEIWYQMSAYLIEAMEESGFLD